MSTMNTANNVLGDMDDAKRQETLRFIGMLADPLNRKILAKLASNHSPIAANDIPTKLLSAERPQIISRLGRLESYGLVKSEKITTNGAFRRRYVINDMGKDWVHKYMKEESKQFS